MLIVDNGMVKTSIEDFHSYEVIKESCDDTLDKALKECADCVVISIIKGDKEVSVRFLEANSPSRFQEKKEIDKDYYEVELFVDDIGGIEEHTALSFDEAYHIALKIMG